MIRKEYSAGAVKHLFWFMEFRKVVEMLAQGMTMDEIRAQNKEQNLFGCPTTERAVQIFNVVSARIQSLDESFYPVFLRGDLATQKLFALVSAMAYDTLFFDFIYEVVREKMIIGSNELKDSDLRVFFRSKQEQDETAAKWTEQTCSKLSTVYKSMLYDAGMTNKAKGTRQIYRPVMEREMEQWLQNHGLSIMINALTGVR